MKKLLLVLLIFFSQYNLVYSQCFEEDDNGTEHQIPCPGGEEGGGTGTPVPIDDYLPILVVLGITLGGAVVYKNRKRLS